MGFLSRLFGARSTDRAQTVDQSQASKFRQFDPHASHSEAHEAGEPAIAGSPGAVSPAPVPAASASTLLSFEIDWKAESRRFPAAIHDAQLLVTDVEGLSDDALQAVVAKRRSKDTPFVVVSPGLHATALALAGTDVVSVRAVALPGQPLWSLLQDLAVFSCACVLTKDLGYESALSSRHEAEGMTAEPWPGLVLPDSSWSDVEEADLGKVAVLRITDRGASFSCTPAPRLAQHIEYVLRHEAGSDPDGLRARLQRLGRPDAEIQRARSPQPPPDPSVIRIPAGFASPFFVTDAASYEAVLDRPRVLLSAVPIERLAFLMPVLQHGVRESSSVIAIAPAFGARALAAMVANKLRGIVSCLAIELGSAPGAVDSTLATLAAATGAEILVTADGVLSSERVPHVLGTAAKVAAGRSYLSVWPRS